MINDTVWERTHRLGGWLFVASGLFGLIASCVPQLRFVGIIVPAIGVAVVSYVYSYIVYQRVTARDSQHSDPF